MKHVFVVPMNVKRGAVVTVTEQAKPTIRNEQFDTHNDRALANKRASNKVVKNER